MAGDTEIADESGKVFKCHSNLRVPKIVICLVCEYVYHVNDFNRLSKGKVKFISEMFVICPEHHGNITSDTDNVNIELNEEARLLITGIKLYEKEKCKEDINKSITSSLTKDTLLLDNTVIEDDLALLRVEIELLKQLNQEIQDKNALLQELLARKNNNIINQDVTSYADNIKKDNSSTREVVPDIIVKVKYNNNTKTLEHVRNKILVDIAVPIKINFANKNGEVTNKCQIK
nr:uncharacterized protein LOC118681259 [Bactrocera oleae]